MWRLSPPTRSPARSAPADPLTVHKSLRPVDSLDADGIGIFAASINKSGTRPSQKTLRPGVHTSPPGSGRLRCRWRLHFRRVSKQKPGYIPLEKHADASRPGTRRKTLLARVVIST